MWGVYQQLCCWTQVWYLGALGCVYGNTCAVVMKLTPQNSPHKFPTSKNFPLASAKLYCQGQQYVWSIPSLVERYLVPHLNHALQIETDSEIQRTAECQWADIVLCWRGRNLIDDVLKHGKLVHQREFQSQTEGPT
jgi:hypothetical protein